MSGLACACGHPAEPGLQHGPEYCYLPSEPIVVTGPPLLGFGQLLLLALLLSFFAWWVAP